MGGRSGGIFSFVVLLLLLQSLALNTTHNSQLQDNFSDSETTGRSSVDWAVLSIELGNTSAPAEVWEQPNGDSLEFTIRQTSLKVNVTVKELASSAGQTSDSTVVVQAIHPIGFVSWEETFNVANIIKGQPVWLETVWTPSAAHSTILNGELSGGYSLTASIIVDVDDTDSTMSNNELSRDVPVAVWRDTLENKSAVPDTLFMMPWGYSTTPNVDGPDAIDLGSWRVDDGAGFVGDDSYHHRNPPNMYPSNSLDRLVLSYLPSTQQCNSATVPLPGFDSQLEPGSQWFGWPVCYLQIPSSSFVSIDIASNAWGSMAAGDRVAMELWRPGGMQLTENITGVGTTSGQWTGVEWHPTPQELGNQAWRVGFVFESDNSGDDIGYHIDDFAIFAVENVSQYTLDIDCVNIYTNQYPDGGFDVIPNDPSPPSMQCTILNNGYKTANVRVATSNTNSSWLPPRIDNDLTLSNGDDVFINIFSGQTATAWINQTIPPGSNVERLYWEIWFEDYYTGAEKGNFNMSIDVAEHTSVSIFEYTPVNPALTLYPGGSGNVTMVIQNTGNLGANYEFIAFFDNIGWSPVESVEIENMDGSSADEIYLDRGDTSQFKIKINAPSDATPGDVSINIKAQGVTDSSAWSIHTMTIVVPVMNDASIMLNADSIQGYANDEEKQLGLRVTNDGNDEDIFTVSLDTALTMGAWKLDLSLSTDLSDGTAGQTPPLDAYGGFVDIVITLPMPKGVDPGDYTIQVEIESSSNPSYKETKAFVVTVLDTYLVETIDEDFVGEQFRGGEPERSTTFEIVNTGNVEDSYLVTLTPEAGMAARIDGMPDSITPVIQPGASHNVTVTYSFAVGVNGELELSVNAKSMAVNGVEDSGIGTFNVGSIGYLEITALETPIITEADEYEIKLKVSNRYFENQYVEIEFDNRDSVGYFTVRTTTGDDRFDLVQNDEREIIVRVIVGESALLSLKEDTKEVNFTVWAASDIDVASAQVTVTLSRDVTGDAEGSESSGMLGLVWDIATIGVLILIFVALILVLVTVLRSGDSDDEYDLGTGYEGNVESRYGQSDSDYVPSASELLGDVGIMAATAKVTDSSPPAIEVPTSSPPTIEVPTSSPPAIEVPTSSVPPLPESGLPDGWTMEQWTHYGDQYLKDRGMQ